ncbi:MAG: hypothetical protein M1587_11585 [Thaumarchaeota archaeon]|nr:hypothetical protein [Nitrososphaerota archaeon]
MQHTEALRGLYSAHAGVSQIDGGSPKQIERPKKQSERKKKVKKREERV